MFNRRKEMLVYAILGLLEAGKTSLIKDLLTDEIYDPKSKTLIIVCEEGEEEYEPAFLQKANAVTELIEDEKDFTIDHIKPMLKEHKPDRIVIEYNGMWNVNRVVDFYNRLVDVLFDREVYIQTIDVLNDETFNLYMKNMSSFIVEHFRIAQTVVDNRCTLDTKRSAIRGSVRVINPRASVIFESDDDAFYEQEEELPYDIKADPVDIPDDLFGTWYVDMVDNLDNYKGKTLKLRGILQKPKGLEPGYAVFGRNVMTCCAQDIQFMGFLVKYDKWDSLKNRDYVAITAKMDYGYRKEYGEEGPVFYADNVEAVKPPEDPTVYFTG
ncbi:MAG: GTP-binding protein [Lachnospiraceae bacterium]|jgi:putative membrane protein|nr:GTP-binding protein [Lachnospiraceae bacterium]MEE3461783.1 GTP-binding protein [Lachnospiraceae bacterium]